MQRQPVEAQKGEVEFRRKLVQQQVDGQAFCGQEFDSAGIEAILRARMDETLRHMRALQTQGVPLEPYLEIGAERGQRSLVMQNDLGLTGAAADLSFDMLKSCDYYRQAFQKDRLPFRVCCDANNLPFLSGSLPFVFCYATLHHFPDPTPVIREIHRVIAPGGCFFMSGESYRHILHLNLYRGGTYTSQRKAGALRKLLDYFLAESDCTETKYGIIENNKNSIATWRRACEIFERQQGELKALRHIHAKFPGFTNPLSYALAYYVGGLISIIAYKAGARPARATPVLDCLACPSCLQSGIESDLAPADAAFICARCGTRYPVVEGVAMLMVLDKLGELYPEIYARHVSGARP